MRVADIVTRPMSCLPCLLTTSCLHFFEKNELVSSIICHIQYYLVRVGDTVATTSMTRSHYINALCNIYVKKRYSALVQCGCGCCAKIRTQCTSQSVKHMTQHYLTEQNGTEQLTFPPYRPTPFVILVGTSENTHLGLGDIQK